MPTSGTVGLAGRPQEAQSLMNSALHGGLVPLSTPLQSSCRHYPRTQYRSESGSSTGIALYPLEDTRGHQPLGRADVNFLERPKNS